MIRLKTHDFAASALPIGFNNYKYGLLLFSQLPNRLRGGAPPMSALVTLSCCFMGTAPLALLLGMIFEELMIGPTPGGGGWRYETPGYGDRAIGRATVFLCCAESQGPLVGPLE